MINNTINTNQNEILLAAESFYKKYMTKEVHKIRGSISFDDSIKKLDETDKEIGEGLITELECAKALKGIQNNKSPGSDGITELFEFY